jgi:hypothetical protein
MAGGGSPSTICSAALSKEPMQVGVAARGWIGLGLLPTARGSNRCPTNHPSTRRPPSPRLPDFWCHLPCPAVRDSAAPKRLRARSSSTGASAAYRIDIAASSITVRVYDEPGTRRNRQNHRSAIRLFINRPLESPPALAGGGWGEGALIGWHDRRSHAGAAPSPQPPPARAGGESVYRPCLNTSAAAG